MSLSDEVKRIKEYWKRAEKAEILYCEGHDRELFDFEQCLGCEEGTKSFLDDIQRKSAASNILSRLDDIEMEQLKPSE